jgi:hypothetical protein
MRTKKPSHQACVGTVDIPRFMEIVPMPTNSIPDSRISKAFRFMEEL